MEVSGPAARRGRKPDKACVCGFSGLPPDEGAADPVMNQGWAVRGALFGVWVTCRQKVAAWPVAFVTLVREYEFDTAEWQF